MSNELIHTMYGQTCCVASHFDLAVGKAYHAHLVDQLGASAPSFGEIRSLGAQTARAWRMGQAPICYLCGSSVAPGTCCSCVLNAVPYRESRAFCDASRVNDEAGAVTAAAFACITCGTRGTMTASQLLRANGKHYKYCTGCAKTRAIGRKATEAAELEARAAAEAQAAAETQAELAAAAAVDQKFAETFTSKAGRALDSFFSRLEQAMPQGAPPPGPAPRQAPPAPKPKLVSRGTAGASASFAEALSVAIPGLAEQREVLSTAAQLKAATAALEDAVQLSLVPSAPAVRPPAPVIAPLPPVDAIRAKPVRTSPSRASLEASLAQTQARVAQAIGVLREAEVVASTTRLELERDEAQLRAAREATAAAAIACQKRRMSNADMDRALEGFVAAEGGSEHRVLSSRIRRENAVRAVHDARGRLTAAQAERDRLARTLRDDAAVMQ